MTIILIIIIFIVVLIWATNSNLKDAQDRSNRINYPAGFVPTDTYDISYADTINDKLFFALPDGKWSQEFKISAMEKAEVLENNHVLSKFSLGRAVAGGIIFGAVGGAIGGFSGQGEYCTDMRVRLTFKDGRMFDVSIIRSKTKRNSIAYSGAQSRAQQYVSFYNNLMNKMS